MSSDNNKRIAKNTLMLYFRMLITMIVSLYTSRVVLSALGVADFGLYNVVGGVVAMFGFLNGTLATGTQRFLTFQLGKNDFIELKKTFSTSIVIHGGLAILILILAETIGLWFLNNKMNIPNGRMYAAQWVYQFSIFASLISILQVPYNAALIAHERMNVYAYVSIVEVSLKLLVVYLLLILGFDKLIIYSILIFSINALVALIYRIYCTKQYTECRFSFVWDKELYKSMLSFSGWNLFGCLAVTGATEGVNILLNIFFGVVVNAARGISFQVSNAIMQFVNNFQTAVTPQIIKLYAEGNLNSLKKLLFQNSRYAFLLMFFLTMPVMFEAKIILFWWLKVVPNETVLFCRLILTQVLLYSITRPFVMAIHAIGQMKIINLTAGLTILMILPVSYLFLKLGFPSYVPFIVFICAIPIEFSIEIYFLKKWIGLSVKNLFNETFLPLLKVVIPSLILPFILYNYMDEGVLRFVTLSVCVSVSILTLTYFLCIDSDTRKSVLIYLQTKTKLFEK